jgi:polyisoprenyl-teichoic acid--peptidoglycan teichoic acid transferase
VPDQTSSPPGPRHAVRVEPVRSLRLSLLLTLASAVVPGSGLLPTRYRRYSVFLLPFGVAAIAFVIWALTAGMPTMRHWLVGTTSLEVIRDVLVAVAVIWLASVVVTYLLTRPRDRGRLRAGTALLVTCALAALVAFPLGVAARYANDQRNLITSVFGRDTGTDTTKKSGTIDYGKIQKSDPFAGQTRLNVLLLGGDGGADRAGVRTDTMIVASVDTRTGNTVLLSLPRNLLHVPLPPHTALSRAYGREFYGPGPEGNWMLNAMYRLVPADHPGIYADSDNPGADVLKVTIGYALGLKIDYYALVELSGFKKMVNALGGITLNINYRIPVGGDTDTGKPPDRYLEPGPNQHLNGEDALWYARGRYGVVGGDYSRMDRQRCFVSAMVAQADPATVLTRYQKIASATKELLITDIPSRLLPALVDLGVKVKGAKLSSVVFTPSIYKSYSHPDYSIIKARTAQAIAQSERTTQPQPTKPNPNAGATPRATPGTKVNTGTEQCAYKPVKQ